jgi:hypothetical protein
MYDPGNSQDRQGLALKIAARLTSCGFSPISKPGTREAIYSRAVEGTGDRVHVLVYTSIVPGSRGPEVRDLASDSIKVCAVYRPSEGRERGLVSVRRVHRTGEKDAIVDRVHERMREVYRAAKSTECCKGCGAPKFLSKKGNLVCAELCFLRR